MNILLSLKVMRNQAKKSGLRKHLIAFLAISLLTISGYAQAQTQIKLALCLDATTSIDPLEWALQKRGTASGLHEALYPGYVNGEVEITVIIFAESAVTKIFPVSINDQTTLEGLTGTLGGNWENGSIFALIKDPNEVGGLTNIKSCIDEASTQIGYANGGGNANDGIQRIIDVSTDGEANQPPVDCGSSIYGLFTGPEECALTAADDAFNNGIDVLNILAVGADDGDLPFIQVLTLPTDNDASTQGDLFVLPATPALGDKGFVVKIADFDQYQPAITAKIRAELATTITVTKSWNGGNDPGEVVVQLTCTGTATKVDGVLHTNSKLTTANTASFTVTGFDPDDTCSATETPFLGWTETGNTCKLIEVETSGACTITNTPIPADIPPPTDIPPPPPNPNAVPTLPEWAMILLSLLLVMVVYSGIRRKQT